MTSDVKAHNDLVDEMIKKLQSAKVTTKSNETVIELLESLNTNVRLTTQVIRNRGAV